MHISNINEKKAQLREFGETIFEHLLREFTINFEIIHPSNNERWVFST